MQNKYKVIVFICMIMLLTCTVFSCNRKEVSKEKINAKNVKYTGESDSAYIKESKPYNPLEGLVDDKDRSWIDVDGLRNLYDGHAALVNDNNRDWIGKEVTGTSTVMPGSKVHDISKDEAKSANETAEKERIERVTNNDFIHKIADENTFLPKTVNPFPIEETTTGNITPEVIFGNGAMIIFTKPDKSGWNLKKGQKLIFDAEQYPLDKRRAGTDGQKLIFGYILDGTLYYDMEDIDMNHKYTLTATQAGKYYITVVNADTIITLHKGYIEENDK